MGQYYRLKTFKVDTTVDDRFKEECVKHKVQQGFVLELLMIRWIKLKSKKDKKNVNIY